MYITFNPIYACGQIESDMCKLKDQIESALKHLNTILHMAVDRFKSWVCRLSICLAFSPLILALTITPVPSRARAKTAITVAAQA